MKARPTAAWILISVKKRLFQDHFKGMRMKLPDRMLQVIEQ